MILADKMDDVVAKFKLVARGTAKKIYSDDKFESKRDLILKQVESLNDDLEPAYSEEEVNMFFAEGILDFIQTNLS
jgi:hypothetical protein